jgi:hypothetical protein
VCDATRPVCRHCRVGNPSRARGLCYQCFLSPSIRHQYGPVSYHGRRGIGNLRGAVPLPDEPTTAAPGTPEKLAEFERRAAANRQLFHPLDATDAAATTSAELNRAA